MYRSACRELYAGLSAPRPAARQWRDDCPSGFKNAKVYSKYCQKFYKKIFPITDRTLHYLQITLFGKNVVSVL